MTKYKVGGMTAINGITFVGQHTKIVINDSNGSYKITKYNNPATSKLAETPFLRGFFKIFNAFKMVVGTTFGKISLGILSFGLVMGLIGLFTGDPLPTTEQVTSFSDIILITINIVLIVGMIIYARLIRHLHGLEHKCIETYNKGLPLTIDNVMSQSKETPQCGGTLLGIAIFLNILWIYIFGLPSIYVWIIFPSIGYEMFLQSRGDKWYNKILFAPGWLIQQLTTGNKVSRDTVNKYLIGFKEFIKIEDPNYFSK